MVRGQPHRSRLRAARFEAAGEENRRGGGRGAHRARFVGTSPSCAGYAEQRATRPSPAVASDAPSPASKPHSARARHPFRRHQRRRRRGGTDLDAALLTSRVRGRPRTSSSCTRRSSLPIERPVVLRSQIRSASRLARRLTGSCPHCSRRHPGVTAPSSQRRVLDLAICG